MGIGRVNLCFAGDPDQQPVPGAADRGRHQRQPHHQRLQQAQRAVPPLLVRTRSTPHCISSIVRSRTTMQLVRGFQIIHSSVGTYLTTRPKVFSEF